MGIFKKDEEIYKFETEKSIELKKKMSRVFSNNLLDNIVEIRSLYSNSSDLVEKRMNVSGVEISLLMCEGMVNLKDLNFFIVKTFMDLKLEEDTPQELLVKIRDEIVLAADQKEIRTYGEFFKLIMSGFVVVMINGIDVAVACGLQGFNFRSISEPSSETNLRGSREGFVEPLKVNQTLIRRRIKSPTLKFEMFTIGSRSQTDISLVYLTDIVSEDLLRDIKSRFQRIKTDIILDSGYLQPFFEEKPRSIFSVTGITERPDTLCAKISEGRVGILVDGTPFAIIAPYLFNENFQNLDDYCFRPVYATFIRVLKYFSFFISFLLPGVYVAAGTMHNELIPSAMLLNIAASQEVTPFPLMMEALIIHVIYEIMREAGLRLPRPIGHAVSIVGALVIGDAAVTAGIIGAPMVLIVAMTAISSFVVPSLYEEVEVLKFLFIFLGGLGGFYAITLGFAIIVMNICASMSFGIPKASPVSPFSIYGMRDVVFRENWRWLGRKTLKIQNIPGSNIEDSK